MVDPPQQLQANSSSLKWGDPPKHWFTKNDQSTGSSWGFPFWETSNMQAPHSCIVLHAFEHILAGNVTSQSWHQWVGFAAGLLHTHIISIFLHIPRFLLIAPMHIGLATLRIAWFQQSFAYEVINWWSTFRRCLAPWCYHPQTNHGHRGKSINVPPNQTLWDNLPNFFPLSDDS